MVDVIAVTRRSCAAGAAPSAPEVGVPARSWPPRDACRTGRAARRTLQRRSVPSSDRTSASCSACRAARWRGAHRPTSGGRRRSSVRAPSRKPTRLGGHVEDRGLRRRRCGRLLGRGSSSSRALVARRRRPWCGAIGELCADGVDDARLAGTRRAVDDRQIRRVERDRDRVRLTARRSPPAERGANAALLSAGGVVVAGRRTGQLAQQARESRWPLAAQHLLERPACASATRLGCRASRA